MPFYGELYLRTQPHFLPDELTQQEIAYLKAAFEGSPVEGPVVDLGCGHGRHAAGLWTALRPGREVVGLDLDALSLQSRLEPFPAIRGDLFHLPIKDGALGGAYSWFSTLFVFREDRMRQIVRGVLPLLKPGALFLVSTTPWSYAVNNPVQDFEGKLPDGGKVRDNIRFDKLHRRLVGQRKLKTADGRKLQAEYTIYQYPTDELARLFQEEGYELVSIHGDTQGGPERDDSIDLIVTLRRPSS